MPDYESDEPLRDDFARFLLEAVNNLKPFQPYHHYCPESDALDIYCHDMQDYSVWYNPYLDVRLEQPGPGKLIGNPPDVFAGIRFGGISRILSRARFIPIRTGRKDALPGYDVFTYDDDTLCWLRVSHRVAVEERHPLLSVFKSCEGYVVGARVPRITALLEGVCSEL